MVVIALQLEHDPDDPEAIDVWVDGRLGDEPCRFRLDTGAGTCRVPTTATTADLPATGVSRGVAASGVGLGEDEIVLPLLRLGPLAVEHVSATRTPATSDAVPLLGMSALGRYRCEFRFTTGELELATADVTPGDGWHELEMHAGGQPTMPVRFGDVEVVGCWDTGAGLTAVDLGFARTHAELFEPVRTSVGTDASGVELACEIAVMSACSIGGVAFGPTACALVDLSALNEHLQQCSDEEGRCFRPMTFIIGMPLISQADWRFDFPTAGWTVARPSTP